MTRRLCNAHRKDRDQSRLCHLLRLSGPGELRNSSLVDEGGETLFVRKYSFLCGLTNFTRLRPVCREQVLPPSLYLLLK